VLVVDEVPNTQIALSVLDTDGTDLILVNGTAESPRLLPAIISHEAAHHIADHLAEFHALLYGISTPFSAFLPLAPMLLASRFLFHRVEQERGAPERKAFSIGLALRSLQDSLDAGVKLMFINHHEVLENFSRPCLTPGGKLLNWKPIGLDFGLAQGLVLILNSTTTSSTCEFLFRVNQRLSGSPKKLRRI